MSNLQEKSEKYAESFNLSGVDSNKAKVDYTAGYVACQKDYEEKLRWIPVSEKLPEMLCKGALVSKVVQVKSIRFDEPFCAYYNHNSECWLTYPFHANTNALQITEWRSFL